MKKKGLGKWGYSTGSRLDYQFLSDVCSSAPINEKGEVAYEELLRSINWRDFPVPPMQYQPVHPDEDWKGTMAKNEVTSVSYFALLEAIFGKPVSNDQ